MVRFCSILGVSRDASGRGVSPLSSGPRERVRRIEVYQFPSPYVALPLQQYCPRQGTCELTGTFGGALPLEDGGWDWSHG
jgi:hypothetical protein